MSERPPQLVESAHGLDAAYEKAAEALAIEHSGADHKPADYDRRNARLAIDAFLAETFAQGNPVRPISEYCKAFETWAQAYAGLVLSLGTDIRKSNLLYRLIYRGEQLRTEECPEHQGRWSGYGWGRQCACQDYEDGGYGPDKTGWLPVKDR